jgi:hypothetical protein
MRSDPGTGRAAPEPSGALAGGLCSQPQMPRMPPAIFSEHKIAISEQRQRVYGGSSSCRMRDIESRFLRRFPSEFRVTRERFSPIDAVVTLEVASRFGRVR